MKVAILGSTGRVGSRVARELSARGHSITGIARKAADNPGLPNFQFKIADAQNIESQSAALVGQDALVVAARFASMKAQPILEAARKAGISRLISVGGAGSLELAPGKLLIDSPQFPEAALSEARPGLAFLNDLREESEIDWVFISPSMEFDPGVRTGSYRIGKDQLLFDASGRSWISMEDFGIALADELEKPKHHRERITVGY